MNRTKGNCWTKNTNVVRAQDNRLVSLRSPGDNKHLQDLFFHFLELSFLSGCVVWIRFLWRWKHHNLVVVSMTPIWCQQSSRLLYFGGITLVLKTREMDTRVLKLPGGTSQITCSVQKHVETGKTSWLPLDLLLELLENLWGINTAGNLWC